jgi:hypothetical protein
MVLWSNFKQKKQQQQAQTATIPVIQNQDQNGQNDKTKLNGKFSRVSEGFFTLTGRWLLYYLKQQNSNES